jgi:hypothetical protein
MIAPNSSLQDWHPCCLIKSLGLILQSAPLLLLLMVLTHDVDYVDSKN